MEENVSWEEMTYDKLQARTNVPKPFLNEWLDIKLLGQLSSVLTPLSFFPLLLLTLMILSRSQIFDTWDWPIGLIIILAASFVFVTYGVIVLRRTAEKARTVALERIEDKYITLKGRANRQVVLLKGLNVDHKEDYANQVGILKENIAAFREGAFAPISEQPFIRALILPFGGAGILLFLDNFAYL